jgi:hypothetical protein
METAIAIHTVGSLKQGKLRYSMKIDYTVTVTGDKGLETY